MVKVKDTASFIERAREVHGDRYDYSQSVWIGSQKPITIICRKHGPIVLSEAASHYSKKQCGCAVCNHASAMDAKRKHIKRDTACTKCGCQTWRKSGVCKACIATKVCDCGARISKRWAKACDKCMVNTRERKRLDNRKKCKGCERLFKPAHRVKYCSRGCREKHCKTYRVEVSCCTCGAVFKKPCNSVRMNNCCSLECQRRWSLERNRGRRKPTRQSLAKIKAQWHSKKRSERSRHSSGRKFWAIASRGVVEERQSSDWERKCRTASVSIGQRLTLGFAKKRKATTFEQVVARFDVSGGRYSRLNTWEKKCYSTAKNLKSKRRLRNVRRLSSLSTGSTKAQPKQLTLWE